MRHVLLLLLLLPVAAAGQERFSIPSLDGKLQLPGYWFEALTAEPRPAVISLHGCGGLVDEKGGLSRNRYRIAEYFNVERMHMLLLDSHTPRGVTSVCETKANLRTVDSEDRRADVFAAIRWLAQRPNVDRNRIAVLGYSAGGSVVLSVVDRTDRAVQEQPIQPRAAVAFYPGCQRYNDMLNYDISAPLLMMIGALDDWTPPHPCEYLNGRVRRARSDARSELIVFPEAHHGFDGYGPLVTRTGLPTRNGTATIGGNPEARDKALRRMFEFLSESMDVPLALTHEARVNGHRYVVPPPSGFARADDVAAVPLSDQGRQRYVHYLGLNAPKAFAITEKGGWYFRDNDPEAMRAVLQLCADRGSRCSLYAVDDRVIWSKDAKARINAERLQRNAPPTRLRTTAQ